MVVHAASRRIPTQPAGLPLDDDAEFHLPKSHPAILARRESQRITRVYREGVDEVFFLPGCKDESLLVISHLIRVHSPFIYDFFILGIHFLLVSEFFQPKGK
jgi:hypothetical protein